MVGKAQRAHHSGRSLTVDGGHATLCPPYATPKTKISKTTPCKVGLVPERPTSRREGPRPVRSRRRRCQTRTGEGIGSCILEGLPIRRAFPWRAAAIVATPPPELRAKD